MGWFTDKNNYTVGPAGCIHCIKTNEDIFEISEKIRILEMENTKLKKENQEWMWINGLPIKEIFESKSIEDLNLLINKNSRYVQILLKEHENFGIKFMEFYRICIQKKKESLEENARIKSKIDQVYGDLK